MACIRLVVRDDAAPKVQGGPENSIVWLANDETCNRSSRIRMRPGVRNWSHVRGIRNGGQGKRAPTCRAAVCAVMVALV